MRKILKFLANSGSFLYEEHGLRIVDSTYMAIFGGVGTVTLRNEVLELRFSLEREGLVLDVHAVGRKSVYSWYSMGIVRQLLTGEEFADKESMNRDNIAFLRDHFDDLQDRFSKSNIAATEAACKELERQRSKRMFG